MHNKQARPLFWCIFFVISLGYLCSFFALILPFWYTRFPNSKNIFVRLGLWEVCFERFMTEEISDIMYDGCFYLYDIKLRFVWRLIFRGWFIVCQAFHTMSFICYIITEGIIVSQAIKLISPRGPWAVLSSIISLALIAVFALITLITMGAGVDSESKMKTAVQQDWLDDLDQNTLSWSYGLAAVSLLTSLIPLSILSWFVFPKRLPGGLLLKSAWYWPNKSDWVCRYAEVEAKMYQSPPVMNISAPIRQPVIAANTVVNRKDYFRPTQANPSVFSSTGNSASTTHKNQRNAALSTLQPSSGDFDNDHSVQRSAISKCGGVMSAYDPRSADTVSLLSHPAPSPNSSQPLSQSSDNRSSVQSQRSRPFPPRQEECVDELRHSPPNHLSAGSTTLEGHYGPMIMPLQRGIDSLPEALIINSESVGKTSSTAKSHSPATIQAARPMGKHKRFRSAKVTSANTKSSQNSGSDKNSTTSQPANKVSNRPTVLSARPMSRKR